MAVTLTVLLDTMGNLPMPALEKKGGGGGLRQLEKPPILM